jgi:FtsP/CotA-like multicopper oxidase with cupredoxin domain
MLLKVRDAIDPNGHVRYCYIDEKGNQAPTIRLHPGDRLYLSLQNEISISQPSTSPASGVAAIKNSGIRKHDPCAGPMDARSTNLHFHGLNLPAVCHQDETLRTSVEPGDPPFEYSFQVPRDQPPGIYWYHPHVHGFSEDQLLGGASGALIVEGIEDAIPLVAGLPQRVLVIRDEKMPAAASASEKSDVNRPTKQLSINYVPVPYPKYPPAVIKIRPGAREFWRVVNASADTYVNLSLEFGGKRQPLILVALDGVPLRYGEPGGQEYTPEVSHILLPPAARAEFVITGPPEGVSGQLLTSFVFRGAEDDAGTPKTSAQAGVRAGQDDVDAARPLARIVASTDVMDPPAIPSLPAAAEQRPVPLSRVRPAHKRTLYFSERLSDPSNPNSATLFFITEDHREPVLFDPHTSDPSITVRQGDVEDWTIENRSRESHTFHIHQLHFMVVGSQGNGWEEPTLRDTVNLSAWDGSRRYPSVTLRMDFRDPHIAGTIPFHCHIAQHLDGGMMGTVRIEPLDPGKEPVARDH